MRTGVGRADQKPRSGGGALRPAARPGTQFRLGHRQYLELQGCTDDVRPPAPAKELAEGSTIRPNRIGAAYLAGGPGDPVLPAISCRPRAIVIPISHL
jgi:hypothetical protein